MNRPIALVTLGEAMVRLSPPGFARLEQATAFDVQVGGSEMNSAVTAQRLGLGTRYVTRLPRSPVGRLVRNKAAEHGVDVSHIVWTDEDRVGLYFLEFGASPRSSAVVYDRSGSAMSKIQPSDVDWASAFEGTRCFHTTGITAALSASARETVRHAIATARRMNLLVSFDLNYRKRLWTPEDAERFLSPLMEHVDLLFTTEEDAERVFGITGDDNGTVAAELVRRFELRIAAITVRTNDSIWRNHWTAVAHDGSTLYRTNEYELELVDRVGAGDSFAGGFLYSHLAGEPIQRALDLAVATSALAQTNPGDLNWSTLEEAERLLRGGGKRIER
jgi:2-dehydro-3-deoxygluconokinase